MEGSGGTGGTGGTGDVGNSAVAGTYNVTLQTTETSPGPVDSRVGLATTPTVSTTFTVFDNNSDGTPESIQFPGGSPTPLSSDGITSWVFSTFYDGNGESIIVNAIKNSTTQEISTISVTYLEAGFDPSLGVIDTNYTWTSGTSVSKQ